MPTMHDLAILLRVGTIAYEMTLYTYICSTTSLHMYHAWVLPGQDWLARCWGAFQLGSQYQSEHPQVHCHPSVDNAISFWTLNWHCLHIIPEQERSSQLLKQLCHYLQPMTHREDQHCRVQGLYLKWCA